MRHSTSESTVLGTVFAVLTGFTILAGQAGATEASDPLTLCNSETSGKTCHFSSFNEAINALKDGDRLHIHAGDYREAATLTANAVTITADKGAALRDTAVDGKAALVILGNDTVIEGLECSGIAVPAYNGACIRLRGRNLVLRNVYFHDSQQGLLSGGEVGEVIVEDSLFERLGAIGRAHAIYMSGGDHLVVRRSKILSSKDEGHEIKSRARRTSIEESEIGSLAGNDSRSIDLPNGGEIRIVNNVIQKGPNSLNPDLIGIGLEKDAPQHPPGPVIITGNTLIMDRPGRVLHSLVPAEMLGNFIVSGSPQTGNEWYPDRVAAGLAAAPALGHVVAEHLPRDREDPAQRRSEVTDYKRPSELLIDRDSVTWRGRPLTLTPPEASVVQHLASRPGETASFSELYELLEPDEKLTSSSAKKRQTIVLSAIKTLRGKFREVDQSFRAMTFKPGKGIVWDESL